MTEGDVGRRSTPYDRVGGEGGIRPVVDDFYGRVLNDPTVAPYFTGVDMAGLEQHMVQLLASVLGGPAPYAGRTMRHAHARMGIRPDAYLIVTSHLVAAMDDAHVAEEAIATVTRALVTVEPDIVAS